MLDTDLKKIKLDRQKSFNILAISLSVKVDKL